MTIGHVLSVQVGRIAPLGLTGQPSAFIKRPVTGPVEVAALGIVGDEQADQVNHGGLEKAVYAYSNEHYCAWTADFPEHADKWVAGGVGENLTVEGLRDADLCVGDVHGIGSAALIVCQPRQPCNTFALRFNDKRLLRAMVRNGRAGWYYRVLRSGSLQAGDAIRLEHRPNPDFRFSRLVEIANFRNATTAELAAMAEMPGLASNFRTAARAAVGQEPG
ncbi:MAG: MOSC domain-containing protein [Sphingomicrobium sp.]